MEYKNIPEGFTAAELDELAAVGSIKDNVNFMTLVYLVMCSDGLTVLSWDMFHYSSATIKKYYNTSAIETFCV